MSNIVAKKTISKLFLLLCICFMVTDCKKYPKRGQSINKGEIVTNYTGVNKSCIFFKNDECIINSPSLKSHFFYST